MLVLGWLRVTWFRVALLRVREVSAIVMWITDKSRLLGEACGVVQEELWLVCSASGAE